MSQLGLIAGRACRPTAGAIRPGRGQATGRRGLEEEETAALKRQPYERGEGKALGYGNGHRDHQVSYGAAIIEVPVPRVSDTEETFRSQLLEGWQRRSKLLEETMPLLYVEGLSTRDFKRVLKPLWGKSGLSRSSISRKSSP